MRRVIVALLSCLNFVSHSALAEWRIVLAPDLKADGLLYLDTSYVADKGKTTRRAWVLFDKKFGSPSNIVRSSKSLLEFDCDGNAVRLLEFVTFGEAMGQGRALLRSTVPTDWETVVSGSGVRSAFDFVCHEVPREVLSEYR